MTILEVRYIIKKIFFLVNLDVEKLREALVAFLHYLCSIFFTGHVCKEENDDENVCEEESCHPIVHEMGKLDENVTKKKL